MMRKISAVFARSQRIIVYDPVVYIHDTDPVFADSNDDLLDSGIDNHFFAHRAGHGIGKQRIGYPVAPDKIQRGANHVSAGSGNYGIRFRMYAPAQLIALSGGDVQFFPCAAADVGTVLPPPGSTVIAGRNDFVIADDNCAVLSS